LITGDSQWAWLNIGEVVKENKLKIVARLDKDVSDTERDYLSYYPDDPIDKYIFHIKVIRNDKRLKVVFSSPVADMSTIYSYVDYFPLFPFPSISDSVRKYGHNYSNNKHSNKDLINTVIVEVIFGSSSLNHRINAVEQQLFSSSFRVMPIELGIGRIGSSFGVT
jgi:hypothetical protein